MSPAETIRDQQQALLELQRIDAERRAAEAKAQTLPIKIAEQRDAARRAEVRDAAPIEDRFRPLLRYVAKLTATPPPETELKESFGAFSDHGLVTDAWAKAELSCSRACCNSSAVSRIFSWRSRARSLLACDGPGRIATSSSLTDSRDRVDE